jgi:tRNA(Ile)-lysidine synthase
MGNLDPDIVVKRVSRFAQSRGLLDPGAILVAVSGGQDSLCMLDVLRRLRDDLHLELRVAHLNHMFRGTQSEAEAEFVRELAAKWAIPAEVAAIDVPAYRARHHLAKEVAARYVRYQFLARAAAKLGSTRIAVGHTADDAAETVLINLLRGSGLLGLRGMVSSRRLVPGQLGPALEVQDWRTPELPVPEATLPDVVRPILELSRSETEAYCLARALPFRVDPSNLDIAYRRNWIRTRLIPELEQHAPGAVERIRATSELLADDHAIVDRIVEQMWSNLAQPREERVEFALKPWLAVEVPLQRHLLRKAVDTIAGSLEGLSRVHVEAAQDVIRRGKVGTRVEMPAGVYLEKGYNSFWVARTIGASPAALSMPEYPVTLAVPGEAILPDGTIGAGLIEVAPGEMAELSYRAEQREAYLDAVKVGSVIEVRRRRPGDRFFPLGMHRPKKLHDFMVDVKVPRGERDHVPIVATPDAIIWVAGYRIDDRFKVTADTRRILWLSLKRPGISDE